jgi:hypothetical protein
MYVRFSFIKRDSRKEKLQRTRSEFQGKQAPAIEFRGLFILLIIRNTNILLTASSLMERNYVGDEGEDGRVTLSAGYRGDMLC